METSIIIPVYNEKNAIEETLTVIARISKDVDGEVIVLNDGSTDGTNEVLEKFKSQENIRILSHSENKGYGASLKTSIRAARGEYIFITDADSTYPNERIPDMLAQMKRENLDMLVGARISKKVHYPFIRKIPKFVITRLANYISDTKIPDINSGLRVFKKSIAMKFMNFYPNGFSFTTTITMGMLCRDYAVAYTPIDYYKREGKSKISPVKDTLNFFSLLSKIAIYYNPLKVILPFVLVLCMISIAFIVKDVFIRGNLSQSSVLFPIMTLNLLFLGLIADMIVKKFDA